MKKIINPWKGMDGYYCFGCAPNNEAGVKMEFYEDGDDIVSIWHPEAKYQGWVNTLHGGIQAMRLGNSKKTANHWSDIENGDKVHEIHYDY